MQLSSPSLFQPLPAAGVSSKDMEPTKYGWPQQHPDAKLGMISFQWLHLARWQALQADLLAGLDLPLGLSSVMLLRCWWAVSAALPSQAAFAFQPLLLLRIMCCFNIWGQRDGSTSLRRVVQRARSGQHSRSQKYARHMLINACFKKQPCRFGIHLQPICYALLLVSNSGLRWLMHLCF